MNLKILNPEEEIFNGNINSITLPGVDGLFQILNFHIPIISILIKGKIIIKTNVSLLNKFNKNIQLEILNNQLIYFIQGGVLEVNNNNIYILCY